MKHLTITLALGAAVAAVAVVSLARATAPSSGLNEERGNMSALRIEDVPKIVPVDTERSGNPLWSIPLRSLSATRERPIFAPSRRPPQRPVVAKPQRPPPEHIVKAAPPERPALTLIGTVVGEKDGIGIFIDQATHQMISLKTGEGHVGWVLKEVEPRAVTLEKEHTSETLQLPPIRMH